MCEIKRVTSVVKLILSAVTVLLFYIIFLYGSPKGD